LERTLSLGSLKGTTYTLSNLEQMTGTTTATNYAGETKLNQAILGDKSPNGPFIKNLDKVIPDYVLTKTHCIGYCNDCAPDHYYLTNVTIFMKGCTESHVLDPMTGTFTRNLYYSRTIPTKAVHLVRDPFDNIVARFHYEMATHESQFTPEQMDAFQNTKDGFDAWCEYQDKKFAQPEQTFPLFSTEIKKIFKNLPCHAEWFRYIQWHNNVIRMLDEEIHVPLYRIYYEEYASRKYDKTVDGLLQFMNLSKKYDDVEFTSGHSYDSYFSSMDIKQVLKLVQTMARPKTWKLLERYFVQT
jgi:hypothetical protein